MPQRFDFNPSILHSVVGGKSAVDMPALNFKTMAEIDAFLKGYGFDVHQAEELEKLWYFHRRALVLMQEKLGFSLEEIPEKIRERKALKDPRELLLLASQRESKELQRWACALLRCIHVFVHAESDLFSSFSEEIQKQILSPFQSCVFHDGTTGTTFLKRSEDSALEAGDIALLGFESKPFKTSTSTVIKLLAKPNALAMSVFDKLGVRFITKSMFDTFRVVRFLVEENLISFPHIMPDQSTNNLFPVDLFIRACVELQPKPGQVLSDEDLHQYFSKFLEKNKTGAEFIRKENAFSGEDYRFIKFISRKLIRVDMPGQKEAFSFFYPFEVQIVDQESHHRVLSGPSDHQAYKERQRQAARKRLFPEP